MAGLFASGQIVELIVLLVVAEMVLLVWLRRRAGRGLATTDIVSALVPGVCLMLALREGLVGSDWVYPALWLAAAFAAHAIDMVRRWQASGTRQSGHAAVTPMHRASRHATSASDRTGRPSTSRTTTAPRVLPALLIAMLVASSFLVYWWVYDERRYTASIESLWVSGGTRAGGDAELHALQTMHYGRLNRYAWEGAFFLAVLTASIAVIWRGMSAERRCKRQQAGFLALVSHQFKTPIASLRLGIETLELRGTDRVHLDTLTRRALDDLQRLEDLVTNILESARLDEGRVVLRREHLSLGSAVRRTAERMSERAKQLGVRFCIEVPDELHVAADPLAIDAVLRNLLENAIAAVAPQGSGTVTLTARDRGDAVAVEIADTGVGFNPEESAVLFEKFGTTTLNAPARESTGLGLYIVRRLMELAGGSVSASSDGHGRGARFTVVWPRSAGQH